MSRIHFMMRANRLVRVVKEDATASQLLAQAQTEATLPVKIGKGNSVASYDYTQIDPTLTVDYAAQPERIAPPPLGLGYGGFSPAQRCAFLRWIDEPTTAAPAAFQQLYVAYLEVALLDEPAVASAARKELVRLSLAPAWQANESLARAVLLSFWLAQNGKGLSAWLAADCLPAPLWGVALGLQAQLQEPITADEIALISQGWQLGDPLATPIIALRLSSLMTTLGAEPLAHALAQQQADPRAPRPWRVADRDLRLALPQPDLRGAIEPLLAEMLTATTLEQVAQPVVESLPAAKIAPKSGSNKTPATPPTAPLLEDLGWRLVLEFGHSRSEFYEFAVSLAKRHESYSELMDENRTAVHRLLFKKSDLRQFWRLWDYAEKWGNTRIYLNGKELEKWQVYPYSQYLQ